MHRMTAPMGLGRLGRLGAMGRLDKMLVTNPLAAYALALDFKNGAYWQGGTQYAGASNLPGYSYTRSGAVSFFNPTKVTPITDGIEQNADPDFSSATGWMLSATEIEAGQLIATNATGYIATRNDPVITNGATYRYSITVDEVTSGSVQVFIGNVGTGRSPVFTAPGTYTGTFASLGTGQLGVYGTSFFGKVSHLSVEKVLAYGELGDELVTNGDGSAGDTGWTLGNGSYSAVSGFIRVTANGVAAASVYQTIPTVAGHVYEINWNAHRATSGGAQLRIGASGPLASELYSAITDGTPATATFVATGATTYITLDPNTAANGTYADFAVSIKEAVLDAIDDFPANVPPIVDGVGYEAYGALTNLLLYSQDFSNAAWASLADGSGTGAVPSVTANQGLAPDGTLTADAISIPARSADTRRQILYQEFTGTAVPHTSTLWVKGKAFADVGQNIVLNLWDSLAGTDVVVTLSNKWEPVPIVRTLMAAATCNLSFGRSSATTDLAAVEFLVWQGEVVAGNFPDGGPIIATAGSAATVGAATFSVSLANGSYIATYTFDDASTQDIPVTVSDGTFTIPNVGTLDRPTVASLIVQ